MKDDQDYNDVVVAMEARGDFHRLTHLGEISRTDAEEMIQQRDDEIIRLRFELENFTPEARRLDFVNEFHALNNKRARSGVFGPVDNASAAIGPGVSASVLAMLLTEEIGELNGAIVGVMGAKNRKSHKTYADVLDAVADAITILSQIAACFGCRDLSGLLRCTFNDVSERVGSPITIPPDPELETIGSPPGSKTLADEIEDEAAILDDFRDKPWHALHDDPDVSNVIDNARATAIALRTMIDGASERLHAMRRMTGGANNGDR